MLHYVFLIEITFFQKGIMCFVQTWMILMDAADTTRGHLKTRQGFLPLSTLKKNNPVNEGVFDFLFFQPPNGYGLDPLPAWMVFY